MPIFENAKFIACDEENHIYDAMAVDGKGRILWLGEDVPDSLKEMPRIDLKGAAVVPAFGDTHLHFESFAMFENTFNVSEVRSFDEVKAIISAYGVAIPRRRFCWALAPADIW